MLLRSEALTRRSFLRAAGASVLLAAVGCSDSGPAETPGSTVPSSAPENPSGWSPEAVMAQTALSFELFALRVYDDVSATGLVTSESVLGAMAAMHGHHAAHADVFRGLVAPTGVEPLDGPNPYLLAIHQPLLAQLTTEAEALLLLRDVEQLMTQRDVAISSTITDPAMRTTIASIAGVENRHQAYLATLVGVDQYESGATITVADPAPGAVIYG